MFEFWHWAGVQGCIHSYHKMTYGNLYATQTLDLYESALRLKGMHVTAKSYAINLAMGLRKMGCDKESAYTAAACSYSSCAFIASPSFCSNALDILRDALASEKLLHPLAVRSLRAIEEEVSGVLKERSKEPSSNSSIRTNFISDAVMGGIMEFHSKLISIMPLGEDAKASLGYISGALNGAYQVLGGGKGNYTVATEVVFSTLFPEEPVAAMDAAAELKLNKDPDFVFGYGLGKVDFNYWLSENGARPSGLRQLL